MRKSFQFIAAAMTTATVVMISGPGVAEPRQYIDNPDAGMAACLVSGGDTNWGTSNSPDNPYGCAGAICYCCKDDGCYICDNTGYDCTWDGKASSRAIKRRLRALGLPTTRPTTVKPGLTTRPPRGGPPKPGLLEGDGTLLPQGPAPTGRPTAPPPGQLR